MQSTPRPQRKAAVAAEFKMATAGVPDRDSRPTKPQQAPKEPAVLHAPVEAPSKPPMYRAGRQKKPPLPMSAKQKMKKMSADELKEYCHTHHLKPKNNHLVSLQFTVLEHMELMEKKPQPEIEEVEEVPHVWVGGRKKVKPTL
jgi:hypothetical protein